MSITISSDNVNAIYMRPMDCYLVDERGVVKYAGKASSLEYAGGSSEDAPEFEVRGSLDVAYNYAAGRIDAMKGDMWFLHTLKTSVRCADCSHCKPTTDGRRYCQLWSHIVPPEGYCWRGDYGEIADIE